MEAALMPGKQVRVFRECDQKIGLAPPGAARQSARAYDNEVVKRWTAEITKSHCYAARLFANRWDPYV